MAGLSFTPGVNAQRQSQKRHEPLDTLGKAAGCSTVCRNMNDEEASPLFTVVSISCVTIVVELAI